MADKKKKNAGNVDGKYYVDETCAACGLCTDTAPDNFKMTDDGSAAYVYRQPADEKETAASQEALEGCPSSSIGDDG